MEVTVKVLATVKVLEISVEQVKSHVRSQYNSYEWNKKVDRYVELEAKFYATDMDLSSYDTKIYMTYMTSGIRFMKELGYGDILSSGGFAYGHITGGYLNVNCFHQGRYQDTKSNRKMFAEESSNKPNFFFTKQF